MIIEILASESLSSIIEGNENRGMTYLQYIVRIFQSLVLLAYTEEYEIPLRDDLKKLLGDLYNMLTKKNIHELLVVDNAFRNKVLEKIKEIQRLSIGLI